ncbi:MAG: pantoate--beta-alanine ligase, partial [Planctomycetota bacterium]
FVVPGALGDHLCGPFRPGHFRGVLTVVLKLFSIVQPDRAYFGKKDYQQWRILERMARDFNLPVEVVGLPTVREPDGLAMSSRNRYLSPADRAKALCLSRALRAGRDLVAGGEGDPKRVEAAMRAVVETEGGVAVDYISIVDAVTLQPLGRITGNLLLVGAARIGRTRLIDNLEVAAPG